MVQGAELVREELQSGVWGESVKQSADGLLIGVRRGEKLEEP